ncbi:MAG TPA: sodium:proton antiporter, partial [Chloroflexota bacterium]|nr:sodium:proton antiporter [Chloroflexota bacterium]
VLLGLALPWDAWLAMGWRALAVVVGVLVLRRLPAVILSRGLMQATIWTLPEAAFVGWFGPMGVSALFYAALAVQITGIFSVWVVVSLLIVSSVVVFGVTASPFTRLLGKHEGRRGVTP